MNFGDCMSIREHTQHSQCGQCVRYKLLIRRLRNDSAALVHQTKCFEAHLAKQYADRVVYWKARTLSRIPMGPTGRPSICIITDAIDHSKFRVPRSKIFNSKEMGGFIRPCMDMTTVLVHGRYVLMALSEQWVRKDSSWCAELLAYTLGRLDDDRRTIAVENAKTTRYVASEQCSWGHVVYDGTSNASSLPATAMKILTSTLVRYLP